MHESIATRSEHETSIVGERLGTTLQGGSVVLLFGDLGAGKTTFVRGLAKGLGIDPAQVSSPTFVLIQEYRGRLTLYHVDLYRLDGSAVDDLGLDELAESGGVVVIEWADRLMRTLPGALQIRITDQGGNVREIAIDMP